MDHTSRNYTPFSEDCQTYVLFSRAGRRTSLLRASCSAFLSFPARATTRHLSNTNLTLAASSCTIQAVQGCACRGTHSRGQGAGVSISRYSLERTRRWVSQDDTIVPVTDQDSESRRNALLKNRPPHLQAVLQALFVTFLWSTSWVLIKIGLEDLPALPFAGLRYTLAFLCLLPFAARSGQLKPLRRLSAGTWARLLLLGLLFYSITQGAQFVSLFYLPALTVSLMLSFTTILVALIGIFALHERPAAIQWGGMGLYLAGVLVYFYPLLLPQGELFGFAVAIVGVLANALS